MSTLEKTIKFLMSKGTLRRGDEPTEEYSDDEDEKDSDAKRRENKDAVRLTRARSKSIANRIPKAPALRGVPRDTLEPDTSKRGSARLRIPVDGVQSFSDQTMTAARELDRESQTSIYQTTVNQRTPSGIDQRVQQTFVTFDPEPLLQLWNKSKQWKWYLGFAILALIGVIWLLVDLYYQIRNYI